ncbi:MAG TPA: metal-dependent hydrolase [Vicinamibacterales bacterium]|jgi:L-ascorbate metabolism protein UlaG (beta-lactamase superfamily)
MTAPRLSATWLGHGTFVLESEEGRQILLDPWIETNPACPASWKGGGWQKQLGALDLILVTHGHSDHSADALPVAKATGAPVVSVYEICSWLKAKGAPAVSGMNKGGTQEIAGLRVTHVHADHSSTCEERGQIIALGEPGGFVIAFTNGATVYFAGDTALFGDMALIKELHEPTLAFLPIGDHFTMGPKAAAAACRLLGVRQVVPMHYGTFPVLTGTPAELRSLVEPGVRVTELEAGRKTVLTV